MTVQRIVFRGFPFLTALAGAALLTGCPGSLDPTVEECFNNGTCGSATGTGGTGAGGTGGAGGSGGAAGPCDAPTMVFNKLYGTGAAAITCTTVGCHASETTQGMLDMTTNFPQGYFDVPGSGPGCGDYLVIDTQNPQESLLYLKMFATSA